MSARDLLNIRVDKIRQVAVGISDALDEAGLTPAEQLAALGSLISLALAALSPDDRRLATEAHIAGLENGRNDNRLVRQ